MVRPNLLSLHTDLFHTILIKVCNDDVGDLCAARVACKLLNQAGTTLESYKDVDLLSMDSPKYNHSQEGLEAFKRLCYQHNNPTAIYLCGLAEYFQHHMDEGLEKIRLSADAGFLFARYTYDMIQLVITADVTGKLCHRPIISREDCYKMRRKMIALDVHGKRFDLPYLFEEKRDKIFQEIVWCSDCQMYNQWLYWWNYTANNPFLCESCFWKLEIRRFCHYIEDFVKEWPL